MNNYRKFFKGLLSFEELYDYQKVVSREAFLAHFCQNPETYKQNAITEGDLEYFDS